MTYPFRLLFYRPQAKLKWFYAFSVVMVTVTSPRQARGNFQCKWLCLIWRWSITICCYRALPSCSRKTYTWCLFLFVFLEPVTSCLPVHQGICAIACGIGSMCSVLCIECEDCLESVSRAVSDSAYIELKAAYELIFGKYLSSNYWMQFEIAALILWYKVTTWSTFLFSYYCWEWGYFTP